MRVLNFSPVPRLDVKELVLELIVSDGAELQQVNTDFFLEVHDVETVFAAAPRLQALDAKVGGSCTELLPCLRNDPPYGPLRVSQINIRSCVAEADVLALAAAMAAHESLKGLSLLSMNFSRGLNALVDAAAERRFSRLTICHPSAADAETVPALARLLQRGSLTVLEVSCPGFPHAEEEKVLELCAALRACRMLTVLYLPLNTPNGVSRRVVTELLDAAASLPALSVLFVGGSRVQDNVAAGQAFGALIAANPPSLRALSVRNCRLGDEGLAPLLDSLAANNMSEVFERDRLLPALAALAARAELDA